MAMRASDISCGHDWRRCMSVILLLSFAASVTAQVDRAVGHFAHVTSQPEISESRKVLRPGDTGSVMCTGNAPIQWNWNTVSHSQQERYPGNSIVSEDLQITHHGIYKRSLRFTNAQFFNTGRYFCSYTNRDTPSASTTTASPGGGTGVHSGGVPDRLGGASVDVFVSDPDHMFIREGSSMYPGTNFHLVVIYYGQEAVIPCAVSDPDFNVTLIRTIGQQDFTDEEGVTFDPVYGFVVASPYYVFSGSFKCFAKGATEDGLAEEELTAYLMFRG